MWVTNARVRGDKGLQGAPKGCQPRGDRAQSCPTLRYWFQLFHEKEHLNPHNRDCFINRRFLGVKISTGLCCYLKRYRQTWL